MRKYGFIFTCGGSEVVEYATYGRALLRSMVARLKGLSCPVIINHDDALTPELRDQFVTIYPYCEFHMLPFKMYEENGKCLPRWWLLEAFNPELQIERLVTLGTDMLCMGDTGMLLYRDWGKIAAWKEPVRDDYNSGSMVITPAVATADVYKALIEYKRPDGRFGHDQAAVNDVLRGQFTQLPDTVMQFATMMHEDRQVKTDVIWLHYIHKYWSSPQHIPKWALVELEKWLGPDNKNLSGKAK